jgi:hypothetical protein
VQADPVTRFAVAVAALDRLARGFANGQGVNSETCPRVGRREVAALRRWIIASSCKSL